MAMSTISRCAASRSSSTSPCSGSPDRRPPAVGLSANAISYALGHAERPGTRDRHTGAAGFSFGSAGAFSGAPASVNIPVWWYAVLSLTKGINHAIVTGMPDSVGIREVQQQAQLATVSDPVVRAEASQFYNDCFVPARSKYLRDKPTSAAITALLNEYGADDPDWMGSHVSLALLPPTCGLRPGSPAGRTMHQGTWTTAPPQPAAGASPPAPNGGWATARRPGSATRSWPCPRRATSQHARKRRHAVLDLPRILGQNRGHRGGETHRYGRAQITEQFARRGHDHLPA